MSRGRHAADHGSFPRDLVITVVGIIVVAVLVFGGLWVFSSFFGGDDAVGTTSSLAGSTTVTTEEPTPDTTASAPSTTPTTAAPASTTTPTITVRAPQEVTVQVLNAVGTTGLAAEVTADLRAEGYRTVEPDDYEPLLDRSQVLFRDGYGPEAFELAAFFPDAQVGMSPDVPDGVDIIVLLGSSYEGE